MLATLSVERRPTPVTVVAVEPTEAATLVLGDGIEAILHEREATTVIATTAEAERRGWTVGFVAAWLTIEVHSALEAVGLTAAMSKVLAAHEIPANVLAGFYHDHILVPADRADDAIAALESLADAPEER